MLGEKLKTLNLPLHMYALHIIVWENDDQQIKKNIILKFPEFSLQGIFISHFPCSVGTLRHVHTAATALNPGPYHMFRQERKYLKILILRYLALDKMIGQPRWLSGLRRSAVHSLMIARRSLCPEKLGPNSGQGSKGIKFSGWHGLDMSITVTKRR